MAAKKLVESRWSDRCIYTPFLHSRPWQREYNNMAECLSFANFTLPVQIFSFQKIFLFFTVSRFAHGGNVPEQLKSLTSQFNSFKKKKKRFPITEVKNCIKGGKCSTPDDPLWACLKEEQIASADSGWMG